MHTLLLGMACDPVHITDTNRFVASNVIEHTCEGNNRFLRGTQTVRAKCVNLYGQGKWSYQLDTCSSKTCVHMFKESTSKSNHHHCNI